LNGQGKSIANTLRRISNAGGERHVRHHCGMSCGVDHFKCVGIHACASNKTINLMFYGGRGETATLRQDWRTQGRRATVMQRGLIMNWISQRKPKINARG